MDCVELEATAHAIRAALKAELIEFFGSRAQLQELLRQQVPGAAKEHSRLAARSLARAMPEEGAKERWHAHVPDTTENHASSTSLSALPELEQQMAPECPDEPVSDQEEEFGSSGPAWPSAAPNATAAEGVQRKYSKENSTPLGAHWSAKESSCLSMSLEGMACQHFRTVAMTRSNSSAHEEQGPESSPQTVQHRLSVFTNISSRFSSVVGQEEPVRRGPLAIAVTSQVFEISIRAVIVLNCAFMVYAANEDIRAWDRHPRMADTAVELVFLVVYICELMAKLGVYRASYFLDKSNCFDCLLVCLDVWDVAIKWVARDAFSASYLRMFRLIKLGKALRAVQLARAFEKLQAFLTCIGGSLSSLGWSLVMLGVILYMFSLCIVQLIALHFRDSGDKLDDELRTAFETTFGSVQMSMLTLFQLTTDGSGWKQSYELISEMGWVGSVVFLAFVSFTHIAVINIITGIFVESAMQNLAPDRDSLALDHHFREQQATQELEQLFSRSCGGVGSVSPEEFDDLVKAGRLPMLLSLLGLRVQHARDFFKFLSSASPDGKVSVASFVRGCMKLKGSATSFDLHLLQVDVQTMTKLLKDLRRRASAQNARLDLLSPGCEMHVQTCFTSENRCPSSCV